MLAVDNTYVELKQKNGLDITEVEYSEIMLASAYFSDIMCNDHISGPLSESILSAVEHQSHIPATIQRVSGYVSTLRRVSTWLDCFTTDGWSWTIESLNIIICTPFDMYLLLSVRTVVSGDVGGVRADSLRNNNNHVIHESEFQNALHLIKRRCTSPFGSFPSGQIKQAIININMNYL